MSNPNIIYPKGLNVFMPREGAPDFVVADISVQPQKFVAFLKEHAEYQKGEYFKFNLKRGRDGSIYAALDTYKPSTAPAAPPAHVPANPPYPTEEIDPRDVAF